MDKRAVTTVLLALGLVVPIVSAAPAAADEPPPAFNVPVEVLPRIVVPPEVNQSVGPIVTAIVNSLLAYDTEHPDGVRVLFQGLADFSCGVVTLFGRAC